MKEPGQTKILLYYPQWGNRWIPHIEKTLSEYDLTVFNPPEGERLDLKELGAASDAADILVSMWCDGVTAFWSNSFSEKKIISYLRRYELWEEVILRNVKFDSIDAMIFVSEYYEAKFKHMLRNGPLPKRTYVIPNGIDVSGFDMNLNTRDPRKIAMVCTIKNVKNLPLAAQILYALPEEYKIHHIGIPFSSQIIGQVFSYIQNLGLKDRFIFEGHVETDKVSEWLDDKGIILSTSINEGNPNNILEAMAKGIKPVIHNWPGAIEQFPPEYLFNTAQQAVKMIKSPAWEPNEYRRIVEKVYSLKNFEKIHDVIGDVMGRVTSPTKAEEKIAHCRGCGAAVLPMAANAKIITWVCRDCGAWNNNGQLSEADEKIIRSASNDHKGLNQKIVEARRKVGAKP